MKIVILGAGPAGLYCGLLIKKADPSYDITVIERNPPDVTYGWGVVFSDRTLASFQRADYKSYEEITGSFVIWDAIDVHYRGETIRCGGHVIAAISRKMLLEILQKRCAELGVKLIFNTEVDLVQSSKLDNSQLATRNLQLPEHDLLIAADGLNSIVRNTYEEKFKPSIEMGKAKYIWLGADKVLDAFNFIFHETEHGLFQVHAYPFSGTTSTFIVECTEQAWLNAGLDKADEAQSLTFCQQLLNDDLGGVPLLSNNSKWINFPTLKTRNWHLTTENSKLKTQNSVVLLGDAAHTAHFSIGSGTKLAMEDAIALANAIERHPDLETALNEYELERKPVVETFQRAASESQTYFETINRYLGLEPMQFAFQLLTRSGRITYDDLHFRDARFGDAVDRWHARVGKFEGWKVGRLQPVSSDLPLIAPPPMFAPIRLRETVLPNRVAYQAEHSALSTQHSALPSGAGLVLTDICAVSAEGRITPESDVLYEDSHVAAWTRVVERAHEQAQAKIGVQLGHAGRRGSTRPRVKGLDRPLLEGNWPLISASPIPYTPQSQVPKEMDRADMDCVRDQFVWAAQLANEAGFDLLQLHMAHGYLLASFLSPLTNQRSDEYGGDLEHRARFPLEVFDALRAAWPADKPMSVALTATDCARGGFEVDDAVAVARLLKERGCDLIEVLAGQTTMNSEPAYGRGFLTHYSDRIRNEAGIPTTVGGYLTTSNEVNTALAAGRADLCILTR